ncbi:binding-protein-dependent transport systems inner membrane component [Gordonia bronchialis DSM 43247]|uniref:Binding-protein-dependent transport systems inner membrane component n=1 Tax=Gordonia bronchialis (strain ATCC 25592 / DSM 43247 / BCRC 13721 / JCM 3198 / KCTC 3076 / NBRC 16047 / NCTC 10667) TaxID=526226 RepID=D0LC90_GORB4|nr:ABC transporter permease [Gordonia bronchialis]ACY19614.1 binding-protein-dependent transport systems inner membrane component [Gordonia bronchialis DSM 43247]MCC3322392.1 ABC transporter permease [Gordonia bronchialis]QGS26476.1 ABC transporter permease subunit [Gordonia bronchialis]STQ62375.1 Glutathione transport system permease protein gsiC [Gordonia bronchialis]
MTLLRSPLLRFIAIRLLYTVAVLLGVMVAVFFLIQIVPGDPVRIALGTRYTPESYAALRSASGLDQPLFTQLVNYIGHAFTGDLGVSFRNGESVTTMLLDRLPATISLALTSIVVALVIAVPLGSWAALREGRPADNVIRVVSQFGISVPDFWMGILLIGLFSTALGWLPSAGYSPLLDGLGGWLEHIVLPAITVGIVTGAIMTRYVRSSVLEVVNAPYVTTAESKGLSRSRILLSHVGRNALVPVLTISGIQFATLLGGVIVVEVVFAWPGLGLLVYDSVAARDYPVLQGAILLIAIIFLIVNLVVDICYAVIDPRIRLS